MLLNDIVFDFTDFTSDPMLYSARRGKLRNREEGRKERGSIKTEERREEEQREGREGEWKEGG